MTTNLCRFVLGLTLMMFSFEWALRAQQAWHPIHATPSTALDGEVNALVLWDDGSGADLIAGGNFTTAGWQAALYVARWDGVAWIPMGSGFDGPVRALAVYNGELIATGDFVRSGDQSRVLNRIARWDGSEWRPLGTGLNARGWALLPWNGQLYVGGQFTNAGGQLVNRIAVWSGSTWARLDAGLTNDVRSLAVYDNALHAGGLTGVHRWSGSSWQAVGSLDAVFALRLYNGELIAGGSFNQGVALSRIARWNGSAWLPLASGLGNGTEVRSLAVYDNQLVVGGTFGSASGVAVLGNIALWNGEAWSALGSGVQSGVASGRTGTPSVNALVASESALIVGGDFRLAGGLGAPAIAQWSAAQGWSPFNTGISDEVWAIEVLAGRLHAGGKFTSTPGSTLSRRIGAWDGNQWSDLGGGFPENGEVFVSILSQYANELIAAGTFQTAGTTPANGIARWTGSKWITMGSGAQGISNITEFPPDLAVNGGFSSIGGQNAPGWALWDGNDWRPLQTPGGSGSQACLKAYSGILYACSGNTVSRYSPGTNWLPMGSAFNSPVSDLHLHDGQLYAGGSFTAGVARWDGATWQPVGSLESYAVFAMTSWNNQLVVAGLQERPGGAPSDLIVHALVNGTWIALGEPFEQPRFPSPGKFINELESWNGRLVAAGVFTGTASRRAVSLAAFGPVIATTTEIVSVQPADPLPGQPVVVTVRVQSNDGAPIGAVSVMGSPRGACSSVGLSAGLNQATASCSISFQTPGPVLLRAVYSGASQGARTWDGSQSSTATTIGVGDRIFRDGFEG